MVESDHKPLMGLLDKAVADYSPRIQRMRLQLQRFDFRLVYKPGKELFIADTLSRAHMPALFADNVTEGCQEQVHTVLDHIFPRRDTRSRYAKATADDPALQLVKELLLSGWPEKKSHCSIPASPFWNVRHSLSEVDGLILFGQLLVVPVSLRREAIEGIHFGNFGKVKKVRRAKSSVFWHGCDDHIGNMVASCATCQKNRHKHPALPLFPVRLLISSVSDGLRGYLPVCWGSLFASSRRIQQVAMCGKNEVPHGGF
ncbi:uncharacterized protein K02A2.6-like [Daphnia pulicaria]|jgi:hypothetical protein|uniref:uncharacterized protein K02A2.6-like n=1 Tax=Daphnia pulicaria TaxID=35523 RepID=UPI001EE9C0A1|nr:uncharacterized protein K02A2.6-like [Daphnia pulicaria]